MSQVQSFYEADSFFKRLTLRLVRERIGHCLRERYQAPKEMPPELLELVGRLDAIEENHLLRSEREQIVEARTIAGVKPFPDWFVLS
jgi:hypothetical protein